MVAIILVNWNGYKDTIECLESLQNCKNKDFFVVVCDNGSSNDSVMQITNFCVNNSIKFDCIQETNLKPNNCLEGGHVFLYELGENNGFSRGNNIGVQFASLFSPDYFLLLNNDTVVEPEFLDRLIDFQKNNPEIKVLTPLIYYCHDKSLIWNGGGMIFWGFRKYHLADKHKSVVPNKECIPCTFITGCALFFVPELLDDNNRILTESFFFGEEDVEFCLRMKRQKVKMACVLNSIIYHKVGGSRKKSNKKIGHTYIHYLNRLIDVRHFMPKWQYPFYKTVLLLSVVRILKKAYKMQARGIFHFIKKLNSDSKKMEGVSKEFFLQSVKTELNN